MVAGVVEAQVRPARARADVTNDTRALFLHASVTRRRQIIKYASSENLISENERRTGRPTFHWRQLRHTPKTSAYNTARPTYMFNHVK